MSNLRIKIGCTSDELHQAQKLRYEVFNREMKVGLKASEATGLDQDEFDAVCDHILIIDEDIRKIIGTYRLLLGSKAQKNGGFYSAKRLDLEGLKKLEEGNMLEVGRSCIHKEYRCRSVLNLLWHTIAQYAMDHKIRYILGCPSILTQDPLQVSQCFAMISTLGHFKDLGIRPLNKADTVDLTEDVTISDPKVLYKSLPPLLQGYLEMGAKVCGFPVYNRDFGTTIFFIVLDLLNMNKGYQRRFLGKYIEQNLGIFQNSPKHAVL